MSSNSNCSDPNTVEIDYELDELWDYYSGLPNPKWYENLDDEG